MHVNIPVLAKLANIFLPYIAAVEWYNNMVVI